MHLFKVICMSSLGENVYIICTFLPYFFFLDVEWYEFFVYLDIKPLSDISSTNIFFHSIDGIFYLLTVFFTVLVCCSPISLFLLLFPLSEERYPKNIAETISILPVFSSRSFVVSAFTFKSLIHF